MSKGRSFSSSFSDNVSRSLVVSQWQSGSAIQRARLLRGNTQNKPNFPAAIPRHVHLQQDLRSNSLLGGAAAYFGAGVSVCGTNTVDDTGTPSRHCPGHVRDKSSGFTVSRAMLQGFTGWSWCRSIDGADQMLSRTSPFHIRCSVLL